MREKFKGKYIYKKSMADPSVFLCVLVAIVGLVVAIVNEKASFKLLGLGIVFVGIVACIFQVAILSIYKIEINERFMTITNGFISIRSEQIQVSHIASVKIKQDLFGRLFGYGDVIVDIMGKGPVLLPHIKNAEGLRDYLNLLMK